MRFVAVKAEEHVLWHALHVDALLEVFEQQFGVGQGLAECHAMAQTMWENCREDARWIYQNDELCGAVVLREVDGVDFMLDFFISPEHRREGLGTQVLQKLQQKAAERETTLLLEVFPQNTVASAFYRRVGFVQAGVRQPHHLQFIWKA